MENIEKIQTVFCVFFNNLSWRHFHPALKKPSMTHMDWLLRSWTFWDVSFLGLNRALWCWASLRHWAFIICICTFHPIWHLTWDPIQHQIRHSYQTFFPIVHLRPDFQACYLMVDFLLCNIFWAVHLIVGPSSKPKGPKPGPKCQKLEVRVQRI